jgi:hypothetical protein
LKDKSFFKYLPKKIRTRFYINDNFKKTRLLRNRIFHHKPIFDKSPEEYHAILIKTIEWIEPQLKEYLSEIDRFNQVYDKFFLSQ